MIKQDKERWIIDIENLAALIDSQPESAVVASVFKRYRTHGTWNLNPSDLQDVFNELHAIKADLR